MKTGYFLSFCVFFAGLITKINAQYSNDVTLVLPKQNNKFSNLLQESADIELNLPEEDELLKLIVKNDIEYDFTSLILTLNGIEQAYPLKVDDKKMLSSDGSAAGDKNLVYTWSLQVSQLPKTLLYYAVNENLPITADLILKSDAELVKRTNIFNLNLLKGENFELDFKKVANFNKGIESDFNAKEIIRHVFQSPNKQAPEALAVIFSFFIGLSTFIVIMIQIKSIAESDKKVVTLKKNCGTLSFMSMFLIGVLGAEYSFLQYYLNNLSIFGLLKYAFFSLVLTVLAGIKLSKRLF